MIQDICQVNKEQAHELLSKYGSVRLAINYYNKDV